MKMKNTLIIIFTYVVACTLTVLLCNAYYKKKLKDEFKRGLFTGIEYHNKHGKYPSYYHWNNKMKNPDFNIDTIINFDSLLRIERPELFKSGITIKDTVVNGISKMAEKKHEEENYELVKAIWVDNDSLRIIRLFNDGHYDTLK